MLHALAQYSTSYDYTTTYQPLTDTANTGLAWAIFLPILIIAFAFAIFILVAMWRIFTKAGQPGWKAIIPLYNTYILLKIVGRPGWWLLLFLASVIPFVGAIVTLVVAVIVYNDLAKSFGRDVGYTILLIFLPVVGFPLLAWGSAKYQGPAALHGTPPVAPTPPTPPAAPTAPTPPATPTQPTA
jgi:hypothetical protein